MTTITVHVVNTYPYDTTYNRRFSRFDGFRRMWLQTDTGPNINVPVPMNQRELKLTQEILYSPMLRASSSAIFWANTLQKQTLPVTQLIEVKFDLLSLVSQEDYDLYGGVRIREKFLRAFVDDELLESRVEIKARIEALMTLIKQRSTAQRNEILMVSHSFLMKIWETYLNYPDLFEKPKQLTRTLLPENRLYAHGTGFDFTL